MWNCLSISVRISLDCKCLLFTDPLDFTWSTWLLECICKDFTWSIWLNLLALYCYFPHSKTRMWNALSQSVLFHYCSFIVFFLCILSFYTFLSLCFFCSFLSLLLVFYALFFACWVFYALRLKLRNASTKKQRHIYASWFSVFTDFLFIVVFYALFSALRS